MGTSPRAAMALSVFVMLQEAGVQGMAAAIWAVSCYTFVVVVVEILHVEADTEVGVGVA